MEKRVVNLVNFVRGSEPRFEIDLFQPVQEQMKADKAAGLPHTFLLQYDAMLRSDFKEFFLKEKDENTELGVWFENCRQLIEKIGLRWDGRPNHDWDWFVHPGFLEGYAPKDREKIVDEVFRLFKEIFGEYPKVAGSWLLDSHSMNYMCEKYGMKAFCVCREQHAVDAYTLWGGPYSGGYYPSKKNMLSPAQTTDGQIPAPVFRMLGIDPVFSYDRRRRKFENFKTVCTLEPAGAGGRTQKNIDWYMDAYFRTPCLSHGHLTTGQENSFGWEMMNWGSCVKEGYLLQIETLAKMREKGEIAVETLGDTGEKFQKAFQLTPPAALCCDRDWYKGECASYWYNCKNYRANLFIENGRAYVRDIMKFDERYEERYLRQGTTEFDAWYDSLPILDGHLWWTEKTPSGVFVDKQVASVKASEKGEKTLSVVLNFTDNNSVEVLFDEKGITFLGKESWRYETGDHAEQKIFESWGHRFVNKGDATIKRTGQVFDYRHNGFDYKAEVCADIQDSETGFVFAPKQDKIEWILNVR